MYFWNDKQLARDLKNNTVPEKDKLVYLLVYLFVPAIFNIWGTSVRQSQSSPSSLPMGWIGLIGLPIGILIIYYFYTVNRKGDGANFIERYICLALPLTLRLVAFAIPVTTVICLVGIFIFSLTFDKSQPSSMLTQLPAILSGVITGIVVFGYYIKRKTMLLRIASGQMD